VSMPSYPGLMELSGLVWVQKLINSTSKMDCKSYKVERADHMDL